MSLLYWLRGLLDRMLRTHRADWNGSEDVDAHLLGGAATAAAMLWEEFLVIHQLIRSSAIRLSRRTKAKGPVPL